MRLALIHDWLNQRGGAEDVLESLASIYPDRPIFASIYAPERMPPHYQQWDIRTLWMDKLPGIHRYHQPYLPLYPLAWGGLNLSQYDVLLSNKSGFCHGLQYDEQTLHICYCLSPTRYVWQFEQYVEREGFGGALRHMLYPLVRLLRRWDYAAAQRANYFIAISSEIQDRIQRYYHRDSVIIHPPVETSRFRPAQLSQIEEYFLIVSRLVPYKRIDLAAQAATRLGVSLKIAGTGRDLERLRGLAGPTVEFLGFVPDEELPELMARCKAFIFPGLEDFGITPVQAQAAGRPVIAYGGGGALDTVIPGKTGEFFHELSVDSLAEVMQSFDARRYDREFIRRHALQFDADVFARRITTFVNGAWDAFSRNETFVWRDPVS